jgi:hypothetical protein
MADPGVTAGMSDKKKIVQKSEQTQNRAPQKEITEDRHGQNAGRGEPVDACMRKSGANQPKGFRQ